MIPYRWLFAMLGMCLLLQTAASSAGGDKKDKPAKTPNYYPLQVGNRWIYELNGNGNISSMVIRVAKVETIDGVKLTRLEAAIGGNVGTTEHLFQNDKGIFRDRTNGIEATPPMMLMKYPFKPGQKWGGEFTAGGEKSKYAATSAAETIEVPAGKFKTAKITLVTQQKGQSVTTTYWFAENVGFVKQTIDVDGASLVAELQKFERKK